MKLRKIIGLLAIAAAIGFGFNKGVSPVASQEDMPLIDIATDWSPDGNQVLFFSNRAGNFDVWVINADGTNLTNLTEDYSGWDWSAFWSPDGRTIAFGSDRESQNLATNDLWLMDSDGSNPRNLTSDIDENVEGFAWSLDGNYLAFTVNKIEIDTLQIFHSEIWVINLPTGEKTRISPTSEGIMFAYPNWTLDGSLAYLASQAGQTVEVWISNVTSSSREQFHMNLPISEIKISPDGSMIACTTSAYTDGQGTRIDLILLNIQNGDTKILTSEMPNSNAYPQWSPDSSKIAFRSFDGTTSDIWTLSADGSEAANLSAEYESRDNLPIWSPNGEQIAFVSDRSGESNIWVMNADGSNPINLTGNATQN